MYFVQYFMLTAVTLWASNALARSIRTNQCGVAGYSTKVNAYYYDDSGTNAGYAKCAAHCLKDYRCLAFTIDDDETCEHFSIPINGNFKADEDSPFLFYDRNCIAPSTSTSSTATTNSWTTTAWSTLVYTKSTTFSTGTPTKISTKASTGVIGGNTTSALTSETSAPNVAPTSRTMVGSGGSSRSSTSLSTRIATLSPITATTLTSSSRRFTVSTTQTPHISSLVVITTTLASRSAATSTLASSSSKTMTTSTLKAITTTKTSTSTGMVLTLPSGCNIPTSYTITEFYWFNSTHNLDCLKTPDVNDGLGCITFDAEGFISWCDPNKDKNCTICNVDVCSTGLPPQPYGYGAPDDVKFTFSDGSVCEQVNPSVANRTEVGEGFVNCGSSYDFMNFYGTSNADVQMGKVEVNGIASRCADGDMITGYYNAQFRIDCKHDAYFNATCTTPSSFNIPLVRFSKKKIK